VGTRLGRGGGTEVDVSDIRTSFEYLEWAHERMMRAVNELTPEEFSRDLGASHRSIRETLVHMMSAEWMWLSRWHGISPPSMLDAEAFPTREALEERWSRIRIELSRFLGQVRDGDLPRALNYRNTKGEELALPLVCSLQHVVHHGTYHRGQVATLLRQMGKQPVSTDLFQFYLEDESRLERITPKWQLSGPSPDGEDEEED
jgi:uncharacterized damage-inducible protein DinB